MASNQAAFLDEVGKTLRVGQATIPTPGPDDIVIRNHAIAINPIDFLQCTKGVYLKNFPAVVGSDVAGEVYDVGSNVSTFKKGSRAVGHCWAFETKDASDGGYQFYSRVPAGNSALIPDHISYQDASVLPMAVDTSACGLFGKGFLEIPWPYENTNDKSEQGTIIVYGASSSVGSMAVQLASCAGVRVIGIAGKSNFDLVKEAGAAEVFDYNSSTVVDDVVNAVGKGTFIGIYDAIGTEPAFKVVVPVLEKLGRGKYVTTKGTPENLPEGVYNKRVYGIGDFSWPLWQKFIGQALASGKLKTLPKVEIHGQGLETLQSAMEKVNKGLSGTKLVVELP